MSYSRRNDLAREDTQMRGDESIDQQVERLFEELDQQYDIKAPVRNRRLNANTPSPTKKQSSLKSHNYSSPIKQELDNINKEQNSMYQKIQVRPNLSSQTKNNTHSKSATLEVIQEKNYSANNNPNTSSTVSAITAEAVLKDQSSTILSNNPNQYGLKYKGYQRQNQMPERITGGSRSTLTNYPSHNTLEQQYSGDLKPTKDRKLSQAIPQYSKVGQKFSQQTLDQLSGLNNSVKYPQPEKLQAVNGKPYTTTISHDKSDSKI